MIIKTAGRDLKVGQTVQGLFTMTGRDMIVSVVAYDHEMAQYFRGGAATVEVASGRKITVSMADQYDLVSAL